ncbi:MAG: hypothetical protein AAGG56_05590 [Pseudomonadota bacterium]
MKVTKHYSVGMRILLFLAGIVFGAIALSALPYAVKSTDGQIFTALMGLSSLGGFYGAFVGKQSI